MNKNTLPLNNQEQASRSTRANQLTESLLSGLSQLNNANTQMDRDQADAGLTEISQEVAEFGTDDVIKNIDQKLDQTTVEFSSQRNSMNVGFADKVIKTAESVTIDMGNMGSGWERMSAPDAVKMIQEYPLRSAVSQRRRIIEEQLNNYLGGSKQFNDSFNNKINKLSVAKGLVQGLALRVPQSKK